MKSEILFVDRNFKEEINNLRRQEYAQASGFSVDLDTLQWKTSDDESYVMVARQNGIIVSTMRGEVIEDKSVLEKKLECHWDFDYQLKLPVLLLSRAATLNSHQTKGFNLVLRYWFLKLAIHHKIPMVLGTFVAGSPRQNTLQKMGYRFFENETGWQQSTYRSHRPVIVAALDLTTSERQALHYCQAKGLFNDKSIVFNNEYPPLRYVRNL